MSLPKPEPGLVVAYAYLWRHEHRKGQVEGRKVRPSAILVIVQTPKNAAPKVTVAPLTHIPPTHADTAIEMPTRGKQALGLDDERSWIMLDEVNAFDWPGDDLHPVPGRKARFAYGFKGTITMDLLRRHCTLTYTVIPYTHLNAI